MAFAFFAEKKMKSKSYILACILLAAGCTVHNPEPATYRANGVGARELAELLSTLPLGAEQAAEVHMAVAASEANGYDQEYLMKDAFQAPGSGIGDVSGETKASMFSVPLRDLLSGEDARFSPRELEESGLQIYWPYSENWDGVQLPVITYDPGNNSPSNIGYMPDGSKVLVTEDLARERPVWIVSTNTDAQYTSLEMLRRQDPSWGEGGGEILVKGGTDVKTLILRSFKAKRQFDSWFAGGSEFFVKTGAVEDFWASTEAELRLYQPSITDFMIVVKRGEVGKELPFNAILVSEWNSQIESIGFMICEDDGGTRTSWKCTALVRYNSKSYGVEMELPINSRDDIVWRGALTKGFIEKHSGEACHFGDVDAVLEFI